MTGKPTRRRRVVVWVAVAIGAAALAVLPVFSQYGPEVPVVLLVLLAACGVIGRSSGRRRLRSDWVPYLAGMTAAVTAVVALNWYLVTLITWQEEGRSYEELMRRAVYARKTAEPGRTFYEWDFGNGVSGRGYRYDLENPIEDSLTRGFIFGVVASGFSLLVRRITIRCMGPRLKPGHCYGCGYDLTGNVSGICPECGEPITEGTGPAKGPRPAPAPAKTQPPPQAGEPPPAEQPGE